MKRALKNYYPWLIWALGAAFFFSEYFARVAPSVMVPELMRSFHVNALSLGALSAFFYYAYVGLQLPVGALVDRFGPHKLLTVTAALCGAGCFLFATSHSLQSAETGRFLMGVGAAFAFVGTLKLATLWFSPARFGLLAGITQALGMLGAAVGEGPLSVIVQNIGWRHTMWLIGWTLLGLAILIGFIVRDKPRRPEDTPNHIAQLTLSQSIMIVLRNKHAWINAGFIGFLYAPTAAFAELWGTTYLHNVYHLTTTVAASAISMIFIGWAIGGPIAGFLSDRMGRRKPIMYCSAVAGLIIMSIILIAPNLSASTVFILLFLYGLTNVAVAISYAVASEVVPKGAAGTSMGFANMASVIIGAFFQPIIGWLLDLSWQGKTVNGVPVYSVHDYHTAMIALPACFLVSLIFCCFVKETYCRGQ